MVSIWVFIPEPGSGPLASLSGLIGVSSAAR